MDTETQTRVTLKLFAGCPLNAEMKMHLSRSIKWRQASIMPTRDESNLMQVSYHGMEYLGIYFDSESIDIKQLKSAEGSIKNLLSIYLSDLDLSEARVKVFCQVFIA